MSRVEQKLKLLLSADQDPEKFEASLILDGIEIGELTESDQKFLEQFINVKRISMANCQLKSLKNFPKLHKLR